MSKPNLTPVNSFIKKENRRNLNKHKSFILWLTGLSGAGKSTLANHIDLIFHEKKIRSYVLDADNIRNGLNKDLGFSDEDRTENIRRIGEVSKLFLDSGTIIITAFISPFKKDRQTVRELVEDNEFVEVFVSCPLEVCEKRDTKGLYQKARMGELKKFTGIDSPYESPEQPEIVVNTETESVDESIEKIIKYLVEKKYINE